MMVNIAPSRRAAAVLAAALGLALQTAQAQINIPPTNHWIGPEASCDYPDIQSAIDDVLGPCFLCAPTEDRFLLSLNYVHSGKFVLSDSVAIIGGYSQCEGTQTGNRNTLTSSGPGALVTVGGNGVDVYLGNMTLLGTGAVSPFGGLVQVDGGATLTLENSRVSGGRASQGGGIAMHDGNNRLILRDANISGNVALADGGGIWCEEGGEIDFQSGSIAGNVAETRGGGIGIDDCRLTGSAINSTREISNNTVSRSSAPDAAGKGGGIYARGSDARVELGGLLTRTTIEDNEVARWTAEGTESVTRAHGGGLHLQRGARAVLRNVQFIGNEAPDGGAISLERGALLDMDRTSGPCLTARPSECSAIIGNTATGRVTFGEIEVGEGSAIQAVGSSGEPGVTIDLKRTTLRDNLAMDHDGVGFDEERFGGSLIEASGSDHRVRLEQNLIFSNLIEGDGDDRGDYFKVEGVELTLIHNTIAFNEEAESMILRRAPLTLVGNIFWNPQLDQLIESNRAALLSACNVSDRSISAAVEFFHSFDNPMFVDFPMADFRLSPGSPAINCCDAADSELPAAGFDIEGRARPVADGGDPQLGDYDSGALEHHLGPADEIDLTVAAAAVDDDPDPGATFELTISNIGLTAAAPGNFNIAFEAPMGGFEVVGTNWDCSGAGSQTICTLQSPVALAPGQVALLTLEVEPDASGVCVLTGSSDPGTQPDTDPSNDGFAITVPDCDGDGVLPEEVFADGFED